MVGRKWPKECKQLSLFGDGEGNVTTSVDLVDK
jgi:hypothetical protein